jgi:hypothetical protein
VDPMGRVPLEERGNPFSHAHKMKTIIACLSTYSVFSPLSPFLLPGSKQQPSLSRSFSLFFALPMGALRCHSEAKNHN